MDSSSATAEADRQQGRWTPNEWETRSTVRKIREGKRENSKHARFYDQLQGHLPITLDGPVGWNHFLSGPEGRTAC